MGTKAIIIADDLTGALDSAAPFAARGLSVVAARAPEFLNEALAAEVDVVSVATNSRELVETQARAVLAVVASELESFDGTIFKKIDSRMKGNIAAELAQLADLRKGKALVCPAIPKLGRVVEDGAVTGAGVAEPIDIASQLGALQAEIVDARSDADLDVAVGDAPPDRLYVGAAGMADGLARRLASGTSKTAPLHLPALMAIGSRDPMTLAQVEVLKSSGISLVEHGAPNGILDTPTEMGDALTLVQMVPGEGEVDGAEAASDFARSISDLVRQHKPKTLFICGGESAGAILTTLGINTLEVTGEVLPGVAIGAARNGVPGLMLVTKSGGFGGPQTLVELSEILLADA